MAYEAARAKASKGKGKKRDWDADDGDDDAVVDPWRGGEPGIMKVCCQLPRLVTDCSLISRSLVKPSTNHSMSACSRIVKRLTCW